MHWFHCVCPSDVLIGNSWQGYGGCLVFARRSITVKLVNDNRSLDFRYSYVWECYTPNRSWSSLQCIVFVLIFISTPSCLQKGIRETLLLDMSWGNFIDYFVCGVCWSIHLPGLDSDTIRCVVHVDVSYSYIGNTCFHVVSSKATNTDSMTRPTVYTVNVDVCASCLDGDTVVTYV